MRTLSSLIFLFCENVFSLSNKENNTRIIKILILVLFLICSFYIICIIFQYLLNTILPEDDADQAEGFLRNVLLLSPDFQDRDFPVPSDNSNVLYSFW